MLLSSLFITRFGVEFLRTDFKYNNEVTIIVTIEPFSDQTTCVIGSFIV